MPKPKLTKFSEEDAIPMFFSCWEWKSQGEGHLPCLVGYHPLFKEGVEFEADELFIINHDGTLRKSKTSQSGPYIKDVLANHPIEESALTRGEINSKQKDYQNRCSEEGSNMFLFRDFGKKYPAEWFEEYDAYIGESNKNDLDYITEELPKKEVPKELSLMELLVLLILTSIVIYGLWAEFGRLLFVIH